MRSLKVKDIRASGTYGNEHTLEAHNKAAKFPYTEGEIVIICKVGKSANGEYRTYADCSVRQKCQVWVINLKSGLAYSLVIMHDAGGIITIVN